MTCIAPGELVEAGLNRVLTQYRESPNLLHLIRTHIGQVEAAYLSICDLPSYFDIFTAAGDQLTLIGKRLGFPRCHCVCQVQPVFGFDCDTAPTLRPVVGFCEGGTWEGCGDDGISEICINDDEIYRAMLKVRRYQMLGRFGFADLTASIQTIYGPTARVMDGGGGQVVIAPLRLLTPSEMAMTKIVARVLPIAPGISTRWHFGDEPIFGFGTGWGGFCEPWIAEGAPLETESGEIITTEDDEPIELGSMTRDATWLCRYDVKPYSC